MGSPKFACTEPCEKRPPAGRQAKKNRKWCHINYFEVIQTRISLLMTLIYWMNGKGHVNTDNTDNQSTNNKECSSNHCSANFLHQYSALYASVTALHRYVHSRRSSARWAISCKSLGVLRRQPTRSASWFSRTGSVIRGRPRYPGTKSQKTLFKNMSCVSTFISTCTCTCTLYGL